MKIWLTLVVSAGILGAAVVTGVLMRLWKPDPERIETERILPVVEALVAKGVPWRITLPSQGLVEPKRRTSLASEVVGSVVWVSPKFDNGGEFAAGEELVKLESADYQAALLRARAETSEARLNLATEEARVEQSIRDWKSLGGGEPSELVQRKPHLEAARARVEAALGAEQRADRDLERTVIRAPYDARISQVLTDLGAYLSPGGPIAEIYAVEPYEIRLPLSLDEYALAGGVGDNRAPGVDLQFEAGGKAYAWRGTVVRREGQVEAASRSVYLVAEIGEGGEGAGLMLPGLFLRASIEGRKLDRVFRVPARAFRDNGQLVLIGPGNRLKFRTVEVVLRTGDEALVVSGLEEGERICLTELEPVLDGMEVTVLEQRPGSGVAEAEARATMGRP